MMNLVTCSKEEGDGAKMIMAMNGLNERYNIHLGDKTMRVSIVEEDKNYIKVKNRKGFTSIIHKGLITEISGITLDSKVL